jgi:hypothetical protein
VSERACVRACVRAHARACVCVCVCGVCVLWFAHVCVFVWCVCVGKIFFNTPCTTRCVQKNSQTHTSHTRTPHTPHTTHTPHNTHTHTHCSSSSFIITLSPIRPTACARAQFSGYSSMTNNHSETGQMALCLQNLKLGVLRSHIAFSLLVGALFKKFGVLLNTPRIAFTRVLKKVSVLYFFELHLLRISEAKCITCLYSHPVVRCIFSSVLPTF